MDIFINGAQKQFDCACKKTHTFSSVVLEGGQFEDSLKKLLPMGSHVLYTGTNQTILSRLHKLYRITVLDDGPPHQEEFVNQKQADSPLSLNNANQKNDAGSDFLPLDKLDDIRLVISDGECDNAKYIASKANVMHVILGGGNLSQYAFVTKDGLVSLSKCKPSYIVCEESLVDCALGFADVACSALSLFEWNLFSITNGERPCPTIFTEALKTISSLYASVRQLPKNSVQLKSAVLEAKLRMAVLSGYLDSSLLTINGAFQSAAAMTRLLWHEKREIKPFVATALLIAPVVARAYYAFLCQPIGFCPPADNNLRASIISEYLGIEEEKSIAMMPEYIKNSQIEHVDYRLDLYRDELLTHLNRLIDQLSQGVLLFFKLCDDDGFSYKNYIDSLDTSLCIALSSDILKGDTLLSFMRHKGVLDRYAL